MYEGNFPAVESRKALSPADREREKGQLLSSAVLFL